MLNFIICPLSPIDDSGVIGEFVALVGDNACYQAMININASFLLL
jgi:hypothetical protein